MGVKGHQNKVNTWDNFQSIPVQVLGAIKLTAHRVFHFKVRWEQFSAAVRRFLSLRYVIASSVPFEKKQDGVNISRFCDQYMVCS